jgi:hypothetical protein
MLNPIVRKSHNPISRRDFLKLTALSAGVLAFRPFAQLTLVLATSFIRLDL